MTTVVRSSSIPAEPGAVWSVLADFAAISAWAPNVDHSCRLDDQAEGVGMTRRIQTGRVTVVETVTVYEPDRVLSYRITGMPAVVKSVTNTWTLEPSGGAALATSTIATLTTEIDTGPRPPQKAVARAIGRALGKASDQMLAGLTGHFEGDRA